MDQNSINDQLIQDMRDCADLLRKYASDESLMMNKTASANPSAGVNTQKSEYMQGFMHGFGLE